MQRLAGEENPTRKTGTDGRPARASADIHTFNGVSRWEGERDHRRLVAGPLALQRVWGCNSDLQLIVAPVDDGTGYGWRRRGRWRTADDAAAWVDKLTKSVKSLTKEARAAQAAIRKTRPYANKGAREAAARVCFFAVARLALGRAPNASRAVCVSQARTTSA